MVFITGHGSAARLENLRVLARSWPEHFDDRGNNIIIARRGPDLVLPPIAEAFIAENRRPTGRYLVGHIGAIWDEARSIPPPAPAMLRLYDAMLGR
jgi:hypothetical protein